jgi:hypothetical protein
MPGGFKMKLTGMKEVETELSLKQLKEDIEDELMVFAKDVVRDAKQLAPVDEGFLKNSINYVQNGMDIEIVVNCDYAAYVEFGTRKFAARYVSTLPQNWQQFAAEFKNSGGGGLWEFLKRLTEWVARKGLSGTYSTKTQRRTGKKVDRANEDFDAAFGIALYILKNGIKPHPYLYPAYEKNRILLEKRIKDLLDA